MPTDDRRRILPFALVTDGAGDDEPAAASSVTRMFDRIVEALVSTKKALAASNDFVDELALELRQHRAELAELREQVAALSNRIESTNRVLASRTDHLA